MLNAPGGEAVTDLEISIADLLEIERDNFPDILPEDVLRHFGYDSRPDGVLGKSVLFYRDLDDMALYEAHKQTQKDLAELRQQLKARTEQRDYWKGQTKVTQGRQVSMDDARRLAKSNMNTLLTVA